MIRPASSDAHISDLSKLTDNCFSPGGWLNKDLLLEHRPQQAKMASSVADALLSSESLLFEAGTGVGKSLAYLVPGIMHAMDTDRQLVVATHTISLQTQIQQKDLSLCRRLFDSIPALNPYSKFKSSLLVGRGNYLCPPRLKLAHSSQKELFHSQESEELARISEWAQITKTGLIEELQPRPSLNVWESVNADSSLSSPKTPDCFYQKARAELRKSQLIIINHALLFSLISAGATPPKEAQGILFPKDFMVIDEAHCIPSVASSHFGLSMSSLGMERLLKKLYNPKTQRGLLSKYGNRYDQQAVLVAIEHASAFFQSLKREWLSQKDIFRLHTPNWGDSALLPPLQELSERLGAQIQKCENETAAEDLKDQRRRIRSYHDTLMQCLSFAAEEHVYWLECAGKNKQNVHLHSSPIDASAAIREVLFERKTSAILTSATLSSSDTCSHFKERTGAEHIMTEIESSPFDYAANMRIYIAKDMPTPNSQNRRLDIQYLRTMIEHLCRVQIGGSLVLFTSYYDMHQLARELSQRFIELKRPLFVQGESLSRTEMKQQFMEAGNGILFGTDSFWTGFDVPGPALKQVIICRLPFENPSHPTLEARSEWLQNQGRSPFAEMTLPDAILKFKQGIGRLIRTQEDKGNVVVLDSRILHKPYGRHFLASLPTPPVDYISKDNLDDTYRPF